MKQVNEVTAELEGMGSILAGMSRAMPYAVPAGYFEALAAGHARSWFDSAHHDTLNSASRKTGRGDHDIVTNTQLGNKAMPYAVPQGYFEGLAANVLTAAAEADVVFTSTKAMPYMAPAGYFEALPGMVLETVRASFDYAHDEKKSKARVIPLKPAFVPVRWAVAAMLLVCITIGGYITFFSGNGQTGTENVLASVSKEELQDYLQHSYVLDVNRIENTNDMNQLEVDSRDIEQYLNETGWDVVD